MPSDSCESLNRDRGWGDEGQGTISLDGTFLNSNKDIDWTKTAQELVDFIALNPHLKRAIDTLGYLAAPIPAETILHIAARLLVEISIAVGFMFYFPSPIRNKCDSPRTNKAPSVTAYDANERSPSSFFAITSNSRPGFNTYPVPVSF